MNASMQIPVIRCKMVRRNMVWGDYSPPRDVGRQHAAGLRLTVGRVNQDVEPGQKVQQLLGQRLATAEECCLVGEAESLLERIECKHKSHLTRE